MSEQAAGDRTTVTEHWIARVRSGPDSRSVRVLAADEVEDYRRGGWTVEGPFVPAANHQGAIEALEQIAAMDLRADRDAEFEWGRAVGIAQRALGNAA